MDPAAAKIIADAIITASGSSWPLIVSALATVALSVVAGWALYYARGQLGKSGEQAKAAKQQADAAKEQSETAKKQALAAEYQINLAKATTLLELDQTFQNQIFTDARGKLSNMLKEIEESLKKAKPHQTAEQLTDGVRNECFTRLSKMREENFDEYQTIFKIAEFFETVGLFVKRGYVPIEDIAELYGGGIIRAFNAFEIRIKKIWEDPTVPSGYLEHFKYLAEEVKKIC